MKLEIKRYWLEVVPENETEEAYIEEVLGLRNNGDSIPLIRKNAMGLSCIAYLVAKKS